MFLISIFLFLGSVPLILSLPQKKTPSVALTPAVFDNIQLVEHYAAASYCPGNTIQAEEGTKLRCNKSNNCSRVESAATKILCGIKNAAETDVQGFVATDATNKLTVVAFQGTESKRQFQADLNITLTNINNICGNCSVHSGFWKSWQEARPLVLQAVKSSRLRFPSNRIIATGHSLGGAIATLAAADLRSMEIPVDLYSFGAPRVGNQRLAEYLQSPKEKLGQNFRITHYNDPIPRLPPEMMGYAHYKPEIYISSGNEKSVFLSDLLALDTASVSKGNEQWMILDVTAHRWYFNAIAACHTENPTNATTGNGTHDLASSWAGTIVGLMGNNTNLILVGSKTADTFTASVLVGLLASMSTSAARSFLQWLSGGDGILSYLPTAGSAGVLSSAGTAGLITLLESLFPSKKKMKSR